jgi:uncharacterized damage-inducible protein DinB
MLTDIKTEFRRHQQLAEAALAHVDDAAFFRKPGETVNPLALIVKHVAGNLRSRWTDFLTTDGDKPDRNRDGEFQVLAGDSRARLMSAWQDGWGALWSTLDSLSEKDYERTVTIRGERFTVLQAVLRSLTHTVYHVGQILYVARMLNPEAKWLTIAPGQSRTWSGKYLPEQVQEKTKKS